MGVRSRSVAPDESMHLVSPAQPAELSRLGWLLILNQGRADDPTCKRRGFRALFSTVLGMDSGKGTAVF